MNLSTDKQNYDIAVIGAGPAGMIAAAKAAQEGKSVVIIEKMRSVGRKLSITGKGRCNITNSADIDDFLQNVFPDGRFLYPSFKSFYSYDILELLDSYGVEINLERGGRYFPASNDAKEIVEVLFKHAKKSGVKFILDSRLSEIICEDNCIKGLKYENDKKIHTIFTKKIILCTGGKSYPSTGSTGDGHYYARNLGHTIVTPYPALVPLCTKETYAAEMQGLTLKNVNARLIIDKKNVREEFGEMIFTHFGLSGPIILTLSNYLISALNNKQEIKIEIDFKPALSEEKLDNRLLRDINEHGKMQIDNLFKLWLPIKAIPVFISLLSIDPKKQAHQITGTERAKIVKLLKNINFTVIGHRGFKEAIVTGGGIKLDEINPKTLESKLISGLYFAGETIDLHANTGGYNLQIAYSTGYLAGISAIK